MEDFIIIAIILIIVGFAGYYVYKAKKSGKKCIGCPDSSSCHFKNNEKSACTCGCGASDK